LIGNAICCASRDFCSRHIHFMHQRAKIGIVHHPLKKMLVLATGWRFARKKKIVQSDRGAAESVGLDDIGTSFEVLGVDFLDDFRLRQKK
jgi:hypothetical protein